MFWLILTVIYHRQVSAGRNLKPLTRTPKPNNLKSERTPGKLADHVLLPLLFRPSRTTTPQWPQLGIQQLVWSFRSGIQDLECGVSSSQHIRSCLHVSQGRPTSTAKVRLCLCPGSSPKTSLLTKHDLHRAA